MGVSVMDKKNLPRQEKKKKAKELFGISITPS